MANLYDLVGNFKEFEHQSSTEVYLKEVYGIAFNSVNFSDAQK